MTRGGERRVVLLTSAFDAVGGIPTYSRSLAAALGRVGTVVVVDLALTGGRRDRVIGAGRAAMALARVRPHLLVLGHVGLGPIGTAWRLLGGQTVVVAHGIEIWGPPTRRLRLSLRTPTAVWPVSTWTASEVHRVERRSTVGPALGGAVEPGRVQDHAPADPGRPFRALFVGSLRDLSYKGLDTLVLAAQQVAEQHPVEVRVVGSGARADELRRFVDDHDHTGAVHLLGGIDDDALAEEYRHADVLVLVSAFRRGPDPAGEGLGLVVLEAAAAGVPAIVADQGGVCDTIIEGETGLTVPAGSVDGLASALAKLAADRAETRRMGARARRFVTERHSSDAFADRVARGVDEALAAHPR